MGREAANRERFTAQDSAQGTHQCTQVGSKAAGQEAGISHVADIYRHEDADQKLVCRLAAASDCSDLLGVQVYTDLNI